MVGYNKRMRRTATPGFTLVELMVVLAIIVIISLILIISSQRFNSAVLLRSLAYQVGLSIREAQLYGVAVHEGPVETRCARGGDSKFCSAFGVHFDESTPTEYYLFADVNNNGVNDDNYAPLRTYRAQYGFTISNFCTITNATVRCSASTCPVEYQSTPYTCTPNAITEIDIAFRRPNPDALITSDGDPATQYAGAYIVVQAPGDATRSVSVSLTGQITVTGAAN